MSASLDAGRSGAAPCQSRSNAKIAKHGGAGTFERREDGTRAPRGTPYVDVDLNVILDAGWSGPAARQDRSNAKIAKQGWFRIVRTSQGRDKGATQERPCVDVDLNVILDGPASRQNRSNAKIAKQGWSRNVRTSQGRGKGVKERPYVDVDLNVILDAAVNLDDGGRSGAAPCQSRSNAKIAKHGWSRIRSNVARTGQGREEERPYVDVDLNVILDATVNLDDGGRSGAASCQNRSNAKIAKHGSSRIVRTWQGRDKDAKHEHASRGPARHACTRCGCGCGASRAGAFRS